ncbi:hypothetical protein LR69_00091 [Geobacillus sp. BCO2]|nr:hypothetical protein LR69_00091 [Geobacillus sp. BCO2]
MNRLLPHPSAAGVISRKPAVMANSIAYSIGIAFILPYIPSRWEADSTAWSEPVLFE